MSLSREHAQLAVRIAGSATALHARNGSGGKANGAGRAPGAASNGPRDSTRLPPQFCRGPLGTTSKVSLRRDLKDLEVDGVRVVIANATVPQRTQREKRP